MLECMEILSIATQEDIYVYSIKRHWKLDGSVQSKIVAMAFSMAAEIERDLISKSTIEALKAKKASGFQLSKSKGPGKSKLDKYRTEIEALLLHGNTQVYIVKRYQVTESTVHHWIKK